MNGNIGTLENILSLEPPSFSSKLYLDILFLFDVFYFLLFFVIVEQILFIQIGHFQSKNTKKYHMFGRKKCRCFNRVLEFLWFRTNMKHFSSFWQNFSPKSKTPRQNNHPKKRARKISISRSFLLDRSSLRGLTRSLQVANDSNSTKMQLKAVIDTADFIHRRLSRTG